MLCIVEGQKEEMNFITRSIITVYIMINGITVSQMFVQHLSDGLQHIRFTKSQYDACLLLYSDSVIALVYVDDCIFFSRDSKNTDRVISDLKENRKASKI
jgi:hypothetical protein